MYGGVVMRTFLDRRFGILVIAHSAAVVTLLGGALVIVMMR